VFASQLFFEATKLEGEAASAGGLWIRTTRECS